MPVYTMTTNDLDNKRSIIVQCECRSIEHELHLLYWKDNKDWDEMFVRFHLARLPLIKRIVLAFRYILRRPLGHDEFGEIVLTPQDVDETIDFLIQYLDDTGIEISGQNQ